MTTVHTTMSPWERCRVANSDQKTQRKLFPLKSNTSYVVYKYKNRVKSTGWYKSVLISTISIRLDVKSIIPYSWGTKGGTNRCIVCLLTKQVSGARERGAQLMSSVRFRTRSRKEAKSGTGSSQGKQSKASFTYPPFLCVCVHHFIQTLRVHNYIGSGKEPNFFPI